MVYFKCHFVVFFCLELTLMLCSARPKSYSGSNLGIVFPSEPSENTESYNNEHLTKTRFPPTHSQSQLQSRPQYHQSRRTENVGGASSGDHNYFTGMGSIVFPNDDEPHWITPSPYRNRPLSRRPNYGTVKKIGTKPNRDQFSQLYRPVAENLFIFSSNQNVESHSSPPGHAQSQTQQNYSNNNNSYKHWDSNNYFPSESHPQPQERKRPKLTSPFLTTKEKIRLTNKLSNTPKSESQENEQQAEDEILLLHFLRWVEKCAPLPKHSYLSNNPNLIDNNLNGSNANKTEYSLVVPLNDTKCPEGYKRGQDGECRKIVQF